MNYLIVETPDGFFKFNDPDDIILQKLVDGKYGLYVMRKGDSGFMKHAFEFKEKDTYEIIKRFLKCYESATIKLKCCNYYCVKV